jgi:hypothetical protein
VFLQKNGSARVGATAVSLSGSSRIQ